MKTRSIPAVAALLAFSSACAAQPLQLPGGEHFDSTSGFTIYAKKPAEGTVPDTQACRMTKQYMDFVNERKADRIAELFADDAYVFEPAHETVANGREQIDTFFSRTIGPMSPKVIGVAYVGSGMDCVVEIALETRWNDELQYTMVSLDHFTLGEGGKFSRMIAFTRAMPPGMLPSSIPPEMVAKLKGAMPAE